MLIKFSINIFMSKIFFQRLVLIVLFLIAILIDIPSVFKDIINIILFILLFISTFNISKKKKNLSNNSEKIDN